MPTPIKGTKRTTFKLRASKDFPSREFKVEFTSAGVSISKKGDRNSHHLRWRLLIGQMLMFRGESPPMTKWREFSVSFKGPHKIPDSEFAISFCSRGIQVRSATPTALPLRFWSWRTLLNTAITGI